MTDKIFFSYSRVDTPFVLKLANDLRNAGANIWLDQLDIPPGAHWDNEIEAALNSSTCVLAIISPRSMESNNAMDEISYALEQNKKVIPVLLTNTETSFRLRRLQRIDFTGEYEKGIKQLLKAIQVTNDTTDKAATPGVGDANAEMKNSFNDGVIFGKKQFESEDNLLSERPTSYAKMANQSDSLNATERRSAEEENAIHDRLSNNTQASRKNVAKDTHKKWYGIVTLAAIAASAAITWGVIKTSNQQRKINVQREIHHVPLSISSRDSSKDVKKDTAIIPKQEHKTQARANSQSFSQNVEAPVDSKPEHTQKTIKAERGVLVLEKKEEQVANPVNRTAETVPIEQPEIVSQPVALKETLISDEIAFEVVFEHLPDMELKRSEQPVRFVVTSPVVYNEITLIDKGAIAVGKIILGRIHSSMFIHQVKAANDQLIPVKEKRSNVPIKEIKLNQPYTARIKKGSRVIF